MSPRTPLFKRPFLTFLGIEDPDNTRTPWIGCGSGIRTPTSEKPAAPTHDDVSLPWSFSQWKRRDVDQVDLTALMAALSGTKWPGNGVGIVPTDVLVNEGHGRRKAELALGNAKAIMEQFRVKEGEPCVFCTDDNED